MILRGLNTYKQMNAITDEVANVPMRMLNIKLNILKQPILTIREIGLKEVDLPMMQVDNIWGLVKQWQ